MTLEPVASERFIERKSSSETEELFDVFTIVCHAKDESSTCTS